MSIGPLIADFCQEPVGVYTENLIRVDGAMESIKLAE
jgi:hypothetical protein